MAELLKSTCTISDLPEEILLRIFSLLSKKDLVFGVRETCTLWQTISFERLLWRQLLFCPEFQNQKQLCQIIEILLPVQDYVEEIYIEDVDDFTVEFVFLNSNIEFHNLKKASFGHRKMLDINIFHGFVYKHPYLEEISNNNFKSSEIVMQRFFSIFANERKLRKICVKNYDHQFSDTESHTLYEVLEYDWKEDDEYLNNTFANLVNLECFICEGTICFPEYFVCDTFVELLLKNCPYLHTLIINHAKFVSGSAFECLTSPCGIDRLGISHTLVDDRGLEYIVHAMPKLRSLCIEGCRYVTDIGLAHVSENCPHLEEIIISGDMDKSGSNITSGGLHKLSMDCPSLKSIALCHSLQVNDSGIIALATHCTKLTSIDVRGCTSVTDRSVIALAENCKHLQEIFIDECAHITSASINSLLLKCRKLETLHASTCHQISSIDLEPFEKMPNLLDYYFPEKLSEFHCTCVANSFNEEGSDMDLCCNKGKSNNLNDAISEEENKQCTYCKINEGRRNFLKALKSQDVPDFKVCSSIRDLNLDLCSKLGNDSITQLAKYCPDLRKVSLNGCFNVTDDGVQCLMKQCKYVKHLEVCNLSTLKKSRLTDDSLLAMAEYGQNLKVLFIERISNISAKGVQALLSQNGSLEELHLTVGQGSPISLPVLEEMTGQLTHRMARIDCSHRGRPGAVSGTVYLY